MRRIEREPAAPPAERTQLAELYRQMLAIRRMEEAAAKAYAQGKIGGFLHLYIGQESIAVGAQAACKSDDYWVATYREHGHAYVKGTPARAILADFLESFAPYLPQFHGEWSLSGAGESIPA